MSQTQEELCDFKTLPYKVMEEKALQYFLGRLESSLPVSKEGL